MSDTGFKCPRCGQTEHFTASAVVVATRVDITPDGWDYWSESGNVELYQNALMRCEECGHTAIHHEFEEEE